MKVLRVKESDFDAYNDYLTSGAADRFVSGAYTHVECEGELIECEFINVTDAGSPLVAVGESQ